jgi:hypothetical protein
MKQSELQVREITYRLATNIEIKCNHCTVLPNVRSYNRDWKSHIVTVSAKKRQNATQKSEICQYDVNIKYCTALQMMGIGGEHAAIMAAFLDLPEPQNWPWQFSRLEKHMYLPAETIKLQSQQEASNEEVAAMLADDRYAMQQNLMMQDLPIPRVEASFDMGWQVRSSGGKYGSSTGHALLIGARTRKVLDSVIFNKKCGVCTKHEKCTRSATNVRNHVCVKNYNGSSKLMEAAALVKMRIRVPEEKNISVCTIISDDDSNARAKARHESNAGILPLTVEEPQFKADPSHCKRVFAKGIYN